METWIAVLTPDTQEFWCSLVSLPLSAVESNLRLRSLFDAFQHAEACWLTTVRPDGRPHLAPIWHVIYQFRVYVVTTTNAVRTANVHQNPYVSLALADTSNVIIIEGMAYSTPHIRPRLRRPFLQKYDWDLESDDEYDEVLEIRPRKLMCWGSHGEGRWSFT